MNRTVNRMLKRALSLLLALCLLCAAALAEGGFPVTLTDAAGREVTIEAEPERLVSGYYISTSALIALGLKDRLVGIEAKAKSRPIYALAAPELIELPSVGSAKEFDLEGCAALEPDLAILPLRLKDAAATLEELGVTVLLVDPEDLPRLRQMVELLAAATGADASALLGFCEEKEAFLHEALEGAQRPRVYLAGNGSMLSTAGSAMYQGAMIELGGGENVAAALPDSYWTEVSYEQLLAWNPEVIVMAADAEYSRDDLMGDPQLRDVDAVKNGRVYAMPSGVESWDSPVPGALLGSLWLASQLHPELYSWERFVEDARSFYNQFYGIEIDEALLTK